LKGRSQQSDKESVSPNIWLQQPGHDSEAEELEALEHELMEHEARECKTWVTSEATTSGGRAPQAPVAECPSLGNSQLLACNADSPTELEIALANPNLSPENRKFLGQKRFQNMTKMVPSDILSTARQVIYSHHTHVTDIAIGITV
jgi:hypothetical protein